MARLAMRAYDTQDHLGGFLAEQGPGGSTSVTPWVNPGGSPTYPSGYLGLGVGFWPGGGFNPTWDASLNFGSMVAGRTYFFRAMVLINSGSTSASIDGGLFAITDAALTLNGSCGLYAQAGGQMTFVYNTGSGSVGNWSGSGPTLVAGNWYRIELAITFTGAALATNSYVIKCDGVTVYSGSDMYLGTAPDRMHAGRIRTTSSVSTSGSMHTFDDLAVNDSTGTAQTSYPGDGKVWLLKPTADSARGANWFASSATTTNLFDAVNNTPPVGVASPGTAASQITNAAKDTTGLYDATMQTYTAAGVVATHSIAVVLAMMVSGSSTTTALSRGIQIVSNPVSAELTNSTPALTAGTHPTNWTWTGSTIVYSPSVVFGTAPVVRVRKNTSSTVVLNVESVFMLVESTPPPVVFPRRMQTKLQAVQRSAYWMRGRCGVSVPRLWTPARAKEKLVLA